MKILSASLLGFAITALAGCADPTSPDAEVPELFNITAVDGKDVPFVREQESTSDGTCFTIHQGGELRFVSGGRFEMLRGVEQRFCNGIRVGASATWLSGRYRTSGETIEFFPNKGFESFAGEYRPARTYEDGVFTLATIDVNVYGTTFKFVADRVLWTGS